MVPGQGRYGMGPWAGDVWIPGQGRYGMGPWAGEVWIPGQGRYGILLLTCSCSTALTGNHLVQGDQAACFNRLKALGSFSSGDLHRVSTCTVSKY